MCYWSENRSFGISQIALYVINTPLNSFLATTLKKRITFVLIVLWENVGGWDDLSNCYIFSAKFGKTYRPMWCPYDAAVYSGVGCTVTYSQCICFDNCWIVFPDHQHSKVKASA